MSQHACARAVCQTLVLIAAILPASTTALAAGVKGSIKVAEPFDALPKFVKANADQ